MITSLVLAAVFTMQNLPKPSATKAAKPAVKAPAKPIQSGMSERRRLELAETVAHNKARRTAAKSRNQRWAAGNTPVIKPGSPNVSNRAAYDYARAWNEMNFMIRHR